MAGHFEEGYMGATKWVGDKSNHHLYGAELSKAIREDLKANRIKGVAVRAKTFSGGQSIAVTVKATERDFVPFVEFVDNYTERELGNADWIYDTEGNYISREEFWNLPEAKREAWLREQAAVDYNRFWGREEAISEYHMDRKNYPMFTKEFMEKLQAVKGIVESFNYSDCNGMVDYFDVNFYQDYYINAKERKAA